MTLGAMLDYNRNFIDLLRKNWSTANCYEKIRIRLIAAKKLEYGQLFHRNSGIDVNSLCRESRFQENHPRRP